MFTKNIRLRIINFSKKKYIYVTMIDDVSVYENLFNDLFSFIKKIA